MQKWFSDEEDNGKKNYACTVTFVIAFVNSCISVIESPRKPLPDGLPGDSSGDPSEDPPGDLLTIPIIQLGDPPNDLLTILSDSIAQEASHTALSGQEVPATWPPAWNIDDTTTSE